MQKWFFHRFASLRSLILSSFRANGSSASRPASRRPPLARGDRIGKLGEKLFALRSECSAISYFGRGAVCQRQGKQTLAHPPGECVNGHRRRSQMKCKCGNCRGRGRRASSFEGDEPRDLCAFAIIILCDLDLCAHRRHSKKRRRKGDNTCERSHNVCKRQSATHPEAILFYCLLFSFTSSTLLRSPPRQHFGIDIARESARMIECVRRMCSHGIARVNLLFNSTYPAVGAALASHSQARSLPNANRTRRIAFLCKQVHIKL